MQMPQVQDQHRKLASLAGTWVGEEKMFPSPWDPKGGPATARVDSRVSLDGFFLISDYAQQRDGKDTYQGHGVYGWDAQESCYTMHWFDSMGSGSSTPAKGRWEGNTLTFQQVTPMGHSRYTYVFEAEGRYAFRIEASQDGKAWTPFLESRYTRK